MNSKSTLSSSYPIPIRPSFSGLTGLVVALLLSAVQPARAADAIGQIIAVEGHVSARNAQGTVRPLQLKSPVFAGDEIITGKGAKVQVFLIDDTTLSQGENSTMVIDQYVYDAPSDEGGAVVRFVRGVFRSVTGRLTESNPDRFQIRTGKAVIGVRGCDLILDIQEALERIYVVELPAERSIRFQLIDPVPGTRAGGSPPDVRRAGRVVTLHQDGRFQERGFRSDAIGRLITETTPGAQPPRQLLRLGRTRGTGRGSAGLTAGIPDDPAPDGASFQPVHQSGEFSFFVPPDLDAPLSGLSSDPAPLTSPSPQPAGSDPTPIEDLPDPPPELVARAVAAGMNWDWGFWDTPEGEPVDVYVNGQYLSDASVQSLIAGTMPYYLYGNGQAGALLTVSGVHREMLGIVDLSVRLGGGQTPSWVGAFSLAGNNSALDFNAGGGIGADSALQGQATSYFLSADGVLYGIHSLTDNRVGGRLVGHDDGYPQITGAAGEFRFRHGESGPSVNGVYGVNLQQGNGY